MFTFFLLIIKSVCIVALTAVLADFNAVLAMSFSSDKVLKTTLKAKLVERFVNGQVKYKVIHYTADQIAHNHALTIAQEMREQEDKEKKAEELLAEQSALASALRDCSKAGVDMRLF